MSRLPLWSKFVTRRTLMAANARGPRPARCLVVELLKRRLCLSTAVGNYVWIANEGSGSVSKIDKTNGTVAATIATSIPQFPQGVAVDEDSVWVGGKATGLNQLARISKTTDMVVATVTLPLFAGAWGVAVDPNSVWVTSGGRPRCTPRLFQPRFERKALRRPRHKKPPASYHPKVSYQ
jgi:YVTN family beta-propeller protein